MTTVKRPTRPFPLRAVLFVITIPLLLLIAFLTLHTSSKTTADIHTTTTSTSSSIPEKEPAVTMGFTKTILQVGNGLKPKKGQSVTVHCTGMGKNRDFAQKFWSTKDPGQEPFTFAVGLGQGR
jgi:FKBP-type peptidyl-prolyl cis-trans isomerase